jgi:hypothetical protein
VSRAIQPYGTAPTVSSGSAGQSSASPPRERRVGAGQLRQELRRIAAAAREQRLAQREADVGAAVFLQDDPGVAAGEQVQLDPAVEQRRARGARRQAQPQAERRIVGHARPAEVAHVVFAGGEEQRIRRPALPAADHRGAVDAAGAVDGQLRSERQRAAPQRAVERSPRQAPGERGQAHRRLAPAGEQHEPPDAPRAERGGIDTDGAQRRRGSPAEEAAAQLVAHLGVAVEAAAAVRRPAPARSPPRSRPGRRQETGHQRSRSTQSRNGNQRRTPRLLEPSCASSARHSSGR